MSESPIAHESRIPHSESRLARLIAARAPLTVASFIDLALYHPQLGYYARASQRSGRAGDFFTSVDVGPLFGELLERQIAEMLSLLHPAPSAKHPAPGFDLVEAGAGNGRLAADMMEAARARRAAWLDSVRLHLVEASPAARAEQSATLGDLADRLVSSAADLPDSCEGVLIANELLDAMPVHQVVMREGALREVYVDAALHPIEGEPSTPELQQYLDRVGARLEDGWRVEVGLQAVEWIREASRRLRRGFMILIDYGHAASELYSASHSSGTLTTFDRHRAAGSEAGGGPPWLQHPGERDITAHVDFTSIRAAAEDAGMTTIAFLDQTYFLLGLSTAWSTSSLAERAAAFKTLILPGGLGSAMKVLILGKNVGAPALMGCSFKVRAT